MRIQIKLLWLALAAGCGLFTAGCSGINTGTTVSPATFLLPGIMKADPAPAGRTLQAVPDPVVVVAMAR